MESPLNVVPNGYGLLGVLIGAMTVIGTLIVNFRKGKVDESAVVLSEWRQMVDQHARDITELRDELRAERSENTQLRRSLNDAHEKIASLSGRITDIERRHAHEIQAKDSEIAGLKAQIIQNSRSSAQLLGNPGAFALTKAHRKKRGEE